MNTEAYKIILQQLGGNKFLAMTGAKNLGFSNNGNTLSMKIGSNAKKVKWVRITLTDMDLYDMEFLTERGKKYQEEIVTLAKHEGVYDDMLQKIFTKETGLYTHL